jgi:hypothetical protein
MKTITLSALLLVVTISLSSFVLSSKVSNETTASVKAPGMLRAHRQGSVISLTWSNSANAVEYRIERSNDGQFFDIVDALPNNGNRSNSYKDGSFFPGTLYYRIMCINGDGTEESSNVEVLNVRQR